MTNFKDIKMQLSLGKVMAHYGHFPKSTDGRMHCPFHSPDKSPSLKYDLTSMPNRFKCFGCDACGDVFNFIQLSEPCTPYQSGIIAEMILNAPAPVFVPVAPQTNPEDKKEVEQKAEFNMPADRFINLLEAFMTLCPLPDEISKKYLQGKDVFNFRIFNPEKRSYVDFPYTAPNFQPETIEKFKIGFLGKKYADLVRALITQGFTEDELLFTKIFSRTKSGEIRASGFAGRILYPYIRNGRIVGLVCRQTEYSGVDKFMKCTTHPEANPMCLMNEDILDDCEYVLITEGVTDCIKACEAGIHSITPATIGIPNGTYELLAPKLEGKEVIICFDVDDAGKKGAIATQKKLKACGVGARIVDLPPSHVGAKRDVCDFINRFGAEAFHQLIFKV